MASTRNQNAEDEAVNGRIQSDISHAMPEYYVPKCAPELKPFKGQIFKSMVQGIQFYRLYATSCGFDTRLGTRRKARDGREIVRYVYCNREGEKNAQIDEVGDVLDGEKQKRRRVSTRFGCKARVFFKFVPRDGYVVKGFIEQHTHSLVSDSFKKYMKVNRNLDFVHQKFILNCARANISPMRSYRLFKETVGEYSNTGCTSGDFKNFSRDLKAYVSGVDAQMMLDKLFMKRELCSAFFFDYAVDEHDRLTRVFWADPIARKNFAIFGDVVSFDATYDTNRYKMIFAPFTGKDNHGKLVTFGASLLCGEDKESYGWVLSKFKECVGRGPKMIITDQDLALSIAVEHVLVGTRHRLCMWYIMLKVPEKVPHRLRKNESFTERFNALVWTDLIEPVEFEQKWEGIIDDFDLTDESWFKSMYDIRKYWIPAYFRDFSMSGLCRTTSTSESVNNFYSGYLDKNSNLLAFFMQFESALDSQRHANELLNSADESRLPQLSTPLLLEKHAATIYTTQIFLKVQKQIEAACYDCVVDKIKDHKSNREYCVNDCEKGVFNVMLNKVDNSVACSCKKFVRDGLLCSHAFLILKDLKLSFIPDIYVVTRWTKSARLNPIHDLPGDIEEQLVVIDEKKLVMNQLISEFYQCVGYVDGNKERMCELLSGIRQLKESFASGEDYSSSIAKKKLLFHQYYGTPTPTEVFVLPLNQVKTKGSGSRLKPRQENDVERANKSLRKCSKCNKKTDHDARNCGKVSKTK